MQSSPCQVVLGPLGLIYIGVAEAYWFEATFYSWRPGDMLLFNNNLVAHDATPGVGKRMILPCFGKITKHHVKPGYV